MQQPKKKRATRKQLKPRNRKKVKAEFLPNQGPTPPTLEGMQPGKLKVEEMSAALLPQVVHRAHYLRALGKQWFEISARIAEEYDCEPPERTTLWRWFKEAQDTYLQDIKAFRSEQTMQELNRIEMALRRWMPVAVADHLEVYRKQRIDGETVVVLDENAWQEQTAAMQMVIKLQAQKADLLGLKGGSGIIPVDDKDKTIADLFAFIGAMAAKRVIGTIVEEEGTPENPVLELKSGFEMKLSAEAS